MTKKEIKRIESIANNLEGYKLTLITETYNKKEGNKTFSKKANKVESEIVDNETYKNVFTSVNFFKNLGGTETITRAYTIAGYIPIRLTSVSPDRKTKVIRVFKIEK